MTLEVHPDTDGRFASVMLTTNLAIVANKVGPYEAIALLSNMIGGMMTFLEANGETEATLMETVTLNIAEGRKQGAVTLKGKHGGQ